MIPKAFAKEQITRLAGLRKFPHEPAAIAELIVALQRSDSDQIARETVNNFISYHTECPVPSLIHAEVFRRNSQKPEASLEQKWGPKPKLCRVCRGWGTTGEAPNATFCDCPDGEAFRRDPRLGDAWLRLVNARLTKKSPARSSNQDDGEVMQTFDSNELTAILSRETSSRA